MITKKIVTQKGFRLDDRIIEKIDILAKATERSQNELAEMAFQMLFKDNIPYFIEHEVYDKLWDAENAEYGFGGLYFIREEDIMLIFSQKPHTYEDEILLGSLKNCLPCKESLPLQEDLLLKVDKAKAYHSALINFFIIYDEKMFKYDLHEAVINIDLKFSQMQEWIKSEFDFA